MRWGVGATLALPLPPAGLMTKAGSPPSPTKGLWLSALPVLPLALATVLVSTLVAEPGAELSFLEIAPEHYLAKPLIDYRHLGDMLTYIALASVHCVLCLGVVAYFLRKISALPAEQRRHALVFFCGAAVLTAGLIVYFALNPNRDALVLLGYKAICLALEPADLATALVEDCFAPGNLSPLTLAAWIPTFAGMATIVFAATFTYANACALPAPDEPSWRATVEQRTKALQRSVYALSAVLVSSTITITLFAHLPVALFADKSELARALSHYASGLSTFWWALFSLTLIATFAAPTFLLLHRAYSRDAAAGALEDLHAWLHEHVFVSLRKQFMNAASLLAPLLVGPLSSLFSSLAGGG